jgi:SOS-response transcriptional repressor LexA
MSVSNATTPKNHTEPAVASDHTQKPFALRVHGDSMVDETGGLSFPDDSIIVVDPTATASPGDPVVVRRTKTEKTSFRLLEFYDRHYFLKPLNPRYPTVAMPDDARIIGVVIQVLVEILPLVQREARAVLQAVRP